MNRFKSAKIASILGIAGNLFLFCIKIICAILTNSQAMLSDAFNSLSDICSSIMTYWGNKVASKPKDDSHNLGHGKAEYIYSLLISIVMFILALNVLIILYKSFFLNKKITFSFWSIIICITTIIIKLCLYLYTNKVAKKYNNLLIYANSKDHLSDIFLTLGTLSAVIFSYYNIYYVDFIISILISIWIIINGIKIFKQSYDVLMDKSISNQEKDEVLKIIESYKEIKKINHFNSTPIGYQYQITFTIFVDGNMSTYESHEIANKLEKEITKKIPNIFLVVIHVNPI